MTLLSAPPREKYFESSFSGIESLPQFGSVVLPSHDDALFPSFLLTLARPIAIGRSLRALDALVLARRLITQVKSNPSLIIIILK